MKNINRGIFALAAIAGLVGIAALEPTLNAGDPVAPTLANPGESFRLPGEDSIRAVQLIEQTVAGTAPIALNYDTGFESAEGFTPRDGTCSQNACLGGLPGTGGNGYTGECGFIGDGTQGGSVYPAPWGVSGSNSGNIEAHIETANPFAGTQHLRFNKDICDDENLFLFSVDASVPPSPPQPGLIAPSTFSLQVAIDGISGSSVHFQMQSNSQGAILSDTLFASDGMIYTAFTTPTGGTTPSGVSWDATGAYRSLTVHHDPCANHVCVSGYNSGGLCPNGTVDCRRCAGGDNDGVNCVDNFQCPGGTCEGGDCEGRVDLYYDGQLIVQGATSFGKTSERLLIFTDNIGGTIDVDDIVIETGEACPIVCGNLELGAGEDCDGANDSNCPGLCVAPGETGPGGEGECTCIIPSPTCETAEEAFNGTNTALTHGPWWTFTADAPAYAIETCGTSSTDSYLVIWTGSCDALDFLASNDDCVSGGCCGAGSDPLASCFNSSSNRESCLCLDTTVGQQYWASVYGLDQVGIETNLTLTKRLACDAVWQNGACTDCLGTCTDDVAEADCMNAGDVFVAQKLCETVAAVGATCGFCCDRSPGLGGACSDFVDSADCVGANQVFSLGELCVDAGCNEVLGACCEGVGGTCSNTLQSGCTGPCSVWTQGVFCGDISCSPSPGACCNHINPDPLSLDGVCVDGVFFADCDALSDSTWTKGVVCSSVPCAATFQAIPTVSEWGLVVLTLFLLIGAKSYFGGCEAEEA